jgi:hypothetical protein
VGFYLSGSPGPLELLVLLTVILYRQLSNSLTILTTQANIAIFQYAVEFLLERCRGREEGEEVWLEVAVLVAVLKDALKLLNNSFINKGAAVYKDIDRLLTVPAKKGEAKGRRSVQIIENLSRAS